MKKTSLNKSKVVSRTREKKVFTLPGQKYDVPEEREPLRIFYESLSNQIPSSEMAEFWLMEHGLLSLQKAKKAFEKKQMIKQKLLRGKVVAPMEKSISSNQGLKRTEERSSSNSGNTDNGDYDNVVLSRKRKRGKEVQ